MEEMPGNVIDESALTKGQLRKLNALRKSVGNVVGERAFAQWLSLHQTDTTDEDAELIADTLWSLIERGSVRIPKGGYVVKRGRGRIVVELATPRTEGTGSRPDTG